MRTATRGAAVGLVTIALGVMVLGQAALAQTPGAHSDATAVSVAPVDIGIGHAQADADNNGGSRSATAVRVAGNDFGTTTTDPNASGALLEVPLGDARVRVAPRETSTTSTADGSSTRAYAALADAQIPGFVRMSVLSGNASAVWARQAGDGSSQASSDVAMADFANGALVVVLLHSEGSSDGRGRLYLVRVNESTVLDTNRQDPVNLSVPGVVDVSLLARTATTRSYRGQVVDVMVGGSPDVSQILSRVRAQEDAAAACAGSPGCLATVGTPAQDPSGPTLRVDHLSAGRTLLPFAGGNAALMAAIGLALVLGGAGLLGARRLIAPAPLRA